MTTKSPIVEDQRRIVVEGRMGARLSRHGDGAAVAIQVVREALADEGLRADDIDAVRRQGEDIVVVARGIREA